MSEENAFLARRNWMRRGSVRVVHDRWRVRFQRCEKSIIKGQLGDVAQLGEHLPCTQGVRSSILLVSTNNLVGCTKKELFRVKAAIGWCWLTKWKGKETYNREDIEVIWSRETSAYGGCLGSKRRWRTWYSAKSFGELKTSVNPKMSEWGNPAFRGHLLIEKLTEANLGNWNISLPKGKEIKRDSRSSGERTGKSLVWFTLHVSRKIWESLSKRVKTPYTKHVKGTKHTNK